MELSNDISALKDLVSVLLRRIEVLESENAALRAEVVDLRLRLKLNSKNSHKPPPSDGLSKKPGLPKDTPKKSGGQFGHKGRMLKMVEHADELVLHHASSCPCCARVFSASDVVCVEQRRQVFDIPVPRMEVTEHQLGAIFLLRQAARRGFSAGSGPAGAVRLAHKGIERTVDQRLQNSLAEDRAAHGRPVGLYLQRRL